MLLRHLFYVIVTACFLTAHGLAILKISEMTRGAVPAALLAGD